VREARLPHRRCARLDGQSPRKENAAAEAAAL